MKPILFSASETAFVSKGLGTITDALTCVVTEARNGIYDLEMQIPVNSRRYADIGLDKIILAKPNPYDPPQPFRISKITRPLNGVVTILANHLSYDLKGMPVNAFTALSCAEAVSQLTAQSVIDCPFTITTDIVSSAIMTVAKPYTIRDLMGGVEGSLIDIYHGEYKFDKYSVQLLQDRGQNRGVKIKYGVNLIDLTQEENCSSVYSGVLPFYASEKGIVVGNVQRASGTFAVDRILPLDLTQYFTRGYDEADTLPTVAELDARGAAYVSSNSIGVPKVSISLSFAQLPRKDIYLCDTVTVEFERMGIETSAKVIQTIYNVLEDRYESVDIGDPRANIINSIADETAAREASDVEMRSYLEKSDTAIRAKVSKIGGSNSSFGWVLNDTSHTWYANDTEVMKATANGLEITGKITATSGFIGNGNTGFTIGDTAIYNGLSTLAGNSNGIYLGTDGIALGGGKFKVTSAGKLTATDADISGKITATSGEIAGFTIDRNAIYNGMTSLSDTEHNGVYVGTSGIALGAGAFKVTSAGAVTASNLSITGGSININNGAFYVSAQGALTATSGTFEGNVYAKNIQHSTSDSRIGTFSGAGITDLSILGGKLYNNTVTTTQTSTGINKSLGYANFSNDVFEGEDEAKYVKCTVYVQAPVLYAKKGGVSGTGYYNVENHTHEFTVGTGQDAGKIFIEKADYSGASHSFNIADTQFYKDAVSAATIASTLYQTTGSSTYNTFDSGFDNDIPYASLYSDGSKLYGRVRIRNSNNELLKTIRVCMPDRYNDGWDYGAGRVEVTGATISITNQHKTENSHHYVETTVTPSARAIKSDSTYAYAPSNPLTSRNVLADQVYNDGQDAGAQTAYVSAISAGAAGTPSYSSEDQVYYANVSVTATARGTKADGTYYTDGRTIVKAVDVTTVYEAGVTSGAQTAYVSSITGGTAGAPSWSSEDQVWYSTVPITATARGTKADGTYYTDPRTANTSVDVTAAYNAGKTAGANTVDVTNITPGSAGSPYYSSEDSCYYANVQISATATATKGDGTSASDTLTQTKAVDVSTVYSTAKTAGAETAYVSAINCGAAGTPTYDPSESRWYSDVAVTATARGTRGDGTYYTDNRTITKSVDVTAAYNKGQADAAPSGTKSITSNGTHNVSGYAYANVNVPTSDRWQEGFNDGLAYARNHCVVGYYYTSSWGTNNYYVIFANIDGETAASASIRVSNNGNIYS